MNLLIQKERKKTNESDSFHTRNHRIVQKKLQKIQEKKQQQKPSL